MESSAAVDFVRDHHRAVLITRRRDGGLQSSPVAAAVDGAGQVVVSTREGSAKATNAARDPKVALCVVSDEWYGPWVSIEGTAEVIGQPDALPLLEDYYRAAAGEHPDWDAYREAMVAEGRVLIRVTVERTGGLTPST